MTRLTRLLSPDELEAALRAIGRERYHNLHPFHHLLHGGKLSLGQVQAWALNRYCYQAAIPRKDAALISKIHDRELRRVWAQRIIDHDGREQEEGGIERWLVFGGSWGSTLALAYAQSHPERVAGLILRGIFLCRESEIRWLSEEGGVSQVYPEQWQRYIAPIAPEKRGALVQAYHELLFGGNDAVREQAAKAWSDWESYLIQFEPQPVDGDGHDALAIARLENHYFTHSGWLEGERALLANAHKIRHIPTIIVQGRYDMCTPTQSAWELKQALPDADLRIVQGGHSAFDAPVAQALVQAADEFATLDW